jgi:glutaredoxin
MFCTQVKEFLHTQNVAFTDGDVTSDDSAFAELGRLGVMTTPVTVVDGETVVGYDVNAVDIWHDRAVFHFLTEREDRERYVEHVRRTVKPGGAVIMATFALDGPEKCSGLPVMRYSPETLGAELGSEFRVAESVNEQHQTPSGAIQSFCYTRFTRVS